MRVLIIATGYAPYMFSEAICNAKLALALKREGIQVDAITKVENGPAYSSQWSSPWNQLQDSTTIINYPLGNKLQRLVDVVYSGITFGGNFNHGIRWARRAYSTALKMLREKHYEAIITRSPNDIAHTVGLKLKHKTGITWISNWNDPADPIWPAPYTLQLTSKMLKRKMEYTEYLLKEADILSFPSDSLLNHFTQYFPFIKDKRSIILPHIGLIHEHYPKTYSPASNDPKIRIIHSGNMSPERNPERLFAAMSKLKQEGFDNISLDILGVQSDYVTQLVKKYNLTEQITFLGACSYLESIKKLQEYDVLLLLEAVLDKGIFFASKITDYMQSERPIFAVSPKQGFAADQFTLGNIKYFADNTSIESIIAGLRGILMDWNNKTLNVGLKSFDETPMYPHNVVKTLVDNIKSINT